LQIGHELVSRGHRNSQLVCSTLHSLDPSLLCFVDVAIRIQIELNAPRVGHGTKHSEFKRILNTHPDSLGGSLQFDRMAAMGGPQHCFSDSELKEGQVAASRQFLEHLKDLELLGCPAAFLLVAYGLAEVADRVR